MIFQASTSASLRSALSLAQAGDTVLLAPGGYGLVRIENVQVTGGQVIIASADSGAPAVIEFLNVRNSGGLTFRGVEIGMEAGGGQGVRITGSSNIRLENLNIHGVLDGDPTSDGTGVLVEFSSNVTITGSELHDLTSGIGHTNTDGLTISENQFRLLRVDGIAGTDSDDVLISGNRFSDFYPNATDHADAIQFWQTAAGIVRNIAITDNIIERGAGSRIQGIFMTAQDGYANLVISGNAVIGGMYHGITVAKATDARISDNLVLGYQDLISWILVQNSSDVVVTNNQATAITVTGPNTNNSNLVQSGNVVVPQPAAEDATLVTAWGRIPAALQTMSVNMGTGAADRIVGGRGGDYINGDLGADTMIGGRGNDVYVVDSPDDVVLEFSGGGRDVVRTTLQSYVLAEGAPSQQIEDVVLIGTTAQSATGNELHNVLIANSVNSTLNGGAGDDLLIALGGRDVFTGGAGRDVFRFTAFPEEPVRITDFSATDDMLDLTALLGGYQGRDPLADLWVAFGIDSVIGVRIYVDVDGPAGPATYRPLADLTGWTTLPTQLGAWLF